MPLLHDIMRSSKKNEKIGFIVTNVSEYRDCPGNWGFEVFTDKWLYLARFSYCSEIEAERAAREFCRIMESISSIGRPPEISSLDRALTTSCLREQLIAPLAGSAWPLATSVGVMGL
jgi:hypothetical protein